MIKKAVLLLTSVFCQESYFSEVLVGTRSYTFDTTAQFLIVSALPKSTDSDPDLSTANQKSSKIGADTLVIRISNKETARIDVTCLAECTYDLVVSQTTEALQL